MLKKLFKNKKDRYRNLLLVLIPFVILICIFACISFKSVVSLAKGNSGEAGIIDTTDSMHYHLINGATDLQKDLFKELNSSINKNDEREIASNVVKNFVADFYTWTNKKGQYDVGGLYYIYSPQKAAVYSQARNQFYKYVSNYIEEYGQKNLLEVESVEAECSEDSSAYEIDGKKYKSYFVTCNWTYVNHEHFNEKQYRTKEYFTVIINGDGRFEIVEAYGD